MNSCSEDNSYDPPKDSFYPYIPYYNSADSVENGIKINIGNNPKDNDKIRNKNPSMIDYNNLINNQHEEINRYSYETECSNDNEKTVGIEARNVKLKTNINNAKNNVDFYQVIDNRPFLSSLLSQNDNKTIDNVDFSYQHSVQHISSNPSLFPANLQTHKNYYFNNFDSFPSVNSHNSMPRLNDMESEEKLNPEVFTNPSLSCSNDHNSNNTFFTNGSINKIFSSYSKHDNNAQIIAALASTITSLSNKSADNVTTVNNTLTTLSDPGNFKDDGSS